MLKATHFKAVVPVVCMCVLLGMEPSPHPHPMHIRLEAQDLPSPFSTTACQILQRQKW